MGNCRREAKSPDEKAFWIVINLLEANEKSSGAAREREREREAGHSIYQAKKEQNHHNQFGEKPEL